MTEFVVLNLENAPKDNGCSTQQTLRDVMYIAGPNEQKVLKWLAEQIEGKPTEPLDFGDKVEAHAGGLGRQRFIRAPGRNISKPWMSEGRDHYSWREMHNISLGWDEGES